MRLFTTPAPKVTDQGLFKNVSPAIKKLVQQSRKELRQKGRVEYARAVLHSLEPTTTRTS
jgi:hypothetical protein